jgi:hypothetical protein
MKKILTFLVGIVFGCVANIFVGGDSFAAGSAALSCPAEYTNVPSVSCTFSASGFTVKGISATVTATAGSVSVAAASGVVNSSYASDPNKEPQLVAVNGKASGAVWATITISGLSNQNFTVTVSSITLSDGDTSHSVSGVSRTVNYKAPVAAAPAPSAPTTPTPANPPTTKPSTSTSQPSTSTPNAAQEEPSVEMEYTTENGDMSESDGMDENIITSDLGDTAENGGKNIEKKGDFLPVLTLVSGILNVAMGSTIVLLCLKGRLFNKPS